ncbi:AraC family transcriptional regulator [Rhodomicrobium lacus]|uniref:AraC family transcriptional regulator n=1 Tax=Rhodomicrobium lacus TaxID=2498452 RepID=UPI000F8D258E|nr:AraC family transcriptional regulator [Rhodomicrobium lacus]
MTENIWQQYEARLLRVLEHIHAHLDEDLDLEKLGEIACLSSYHWHRIYRAVHGETAAQTIRRLRLHRAATELVETRKSVSAIAARAGYPNLQSFTRTFGAAYGLPPAAYRERGKTVYPTAQSEKASAMYEVTIKTIKLMHLVGLAHRGPYPEIGATFTQLGVLGGSRGLFARMKGSVALYYDDPDVVPAEKLRSLAAIWVDTPECVEPPLEAAIIEGGDYAMLRHVGPYSDLHKAYGWLYRTGLPSLGRPVSDAPCFEDYVNDPKKTPPAELITDIYVPLA